MKISASFLSLLLTIGCTMDGTQAAEASVRASALPADATMDADVAMSIRNGVPVGQQLSQLTSASVPPLQLDAGWYKFYFGAAGTKTAYSFTFAQDDYVQISITDAYCPGDSFDFYRNGSYLVTTPRVRAQSCKDWTEDPDKAFVDPAYSSTKFSLPGFFNLSLGVQDSPYKGGAAFIRADTRLDTCRLAVSPFVLVNAPMKGHANAAALCKRVGGKPAHIVPGNTADAAKTLIKCGYNNAWFGRLSLLPRVPQKSSDLGCLAFNVDQPADPTVEILACNSRLPVLCTV